MTPRYHPVVRCLAAVAALCLILLGACSCQPRQVAVPAHAKTGGVMHSYTGTGPRVVVLGDSLTVGIWDALYRNLGRDRSVKVAAIFGEGFDGGAFSTALGDLLLPKAAREYAVDDPSVAVVALGTNTVWDGGDVDLALANQQAAVAGFGDACLVWVTLVGESAWDAEGAARLEADAATWADRTVDWAGAVTEHPEYLGDDGIHATPAGYAARASMIAEAVRSC